MSSIAATGALAVRAVTANPAGGTLQVTRCDIHTDCSVGSPASSAPSVEHGEVGTAVLGDVGVGDRATERPGHHLEAVADPQRRHPGLEQALGYGGRARLVHRGGTAGQDDRLRPLGEHLGDRHGRGHDLAEHVALAYAAGDELRVLRPEVDNEDRVEGLLD